MERRLLTIKTAIVSATDKTGLVPLCRVLHQHGCQLIATSGTAQLLNEADIPTIPVETITRNPEAFRGRMKTLSFQLGSGILFRKDDPADCAEAQRLGIRGIDLVICNLYPFHRKPVDCMSDEEMVELIDIGGPTMIRSAAKNYQNVALLSDPEQYEEFLIQFTQHGGAIPLKMRQKLAAQGFQLTAHYEDKIAAEFSRRFGLRTGEHLHPQYSERRELRYGENPQQRGFLLINKEAGGIANGIKLQGKSLSYNNYLDGDAALRCTSDLVHYAAQQGDFHQHAVTIVKHQNPCGAALCTTQSQALHLAWQGDPKSAFGSVICFSHTVESEAAEWLKDKFVEVIVAPGFSEEALNVFAGKTNLRLLKTTLVPLAEGEEMWRSISGGFLVQDEDWNFAEELQQVSSWQFPSHLYPLVKFGIVLSKHLKSNSIALVEQSAEGDYSLIGAGMGQPNRVDSFTRLALARAFEEHTTAPREQVVMVSDGFFPFPDIVQEASLHGIKYIVQPGGSIRDDEVIAAADRVGISMLFTGRRHFRH